LVFAPVVLPLQEIERLKLLVNTVGEANLTPDAWVRAETT